MASGKKNYFRHSFSAGKDDKIVSLICDYGKEAYFHYFRLLELCGEQAADEIPEKFVFHRRTLCAELMVTSSRLGRHLLAMQSALLLEYVLSAGKVEILIPNLPKYLGRYSNKNPPNSSNKRKEKKRKEKKRKARTKAPFVDEAFIYNVVSHLNSKTGKNYKSGTKKTNDLIKSRVDENSYSVEDFKKAIDNQCAAWLEDPKWSKYLRPETLFGNKFESYLENVPPKTHNEEMKEFFGDCETEGVPWKLD